MRTVHRVSIAVAALLIALLGIAANEALRLRRVRAGEVRIDDLRIALDGICFDADDRERRLWRRLQEGEIDRAEHDAELVDFQQRFMGEWERLIGRIRSTRRDIHSALDGMVVPLRIYTATGGIDERTVERYHRDQAAPGS